MKNSFGESLRRLRMEKGLTQRQLAERLHMNRTSVASWETGRHTPDLDVIAQISELLGVDIALLMTASDEPEEAPNVLLVDDKPIILNGGIATLREVMPKARVTGFTEPADVLGFFKSNPVALVFLDIEMRITNGLDLCRELLRISPRTNVIYLTAFPEYALDAWETGASGFLVKPLEVKNVRLALRCLRYPVRGLL